LVRQFLQEQESRIRLFYLPAYSPELNPDEQVWREVKTHGAARKPVPGKDDLRRILLRSLRRLQRMPQTIRAFFQTPDTDYATA
jgi:transposase